DFVMGFRHFRTVYIFANRIRFLWKCGLLSTHFSTLGARQSTLLNSGQTFAPGKFKCGPSSEICDSQSIIRSDGLMTEHNQRIVRVQRSSCSLPVFEQSQHSVGNVLEELIFGQAVWRSE